MADLGVSQFQQKATSAHRIETFVRHHVQIRQ